MMTSIFVDISSINPSLYGYDARRRRREGNDDSTVSFIPLGSRMSSLLVVNIIKCLFLALVCHEE
jgi:hypothetical protein